LLIECQYHETIARKIILVCCSLLNSASNHILDMNFKCSEVEILRLKK
jgi:hypothetical protein